MITLLALSATLLQTPQLSSRGLAGYISMSVDRPPAEFSYGVSLYAAAWPLVENPLRDFQIGLASIWIIPENLSIKEPLLPKGTYARDNFPERAPSYHDVFETIEGGLGFWASTRFGSVTAKFRMNGTANGYNNEISSPGWGFGQTTFLPPEQAGIAQLSNRILVPPDGMTFRPGTLGELLGYAWMALPLIDAKPASGSQTVPIGDQSWTLFLNSQNFRGPVAFYTPVTWTRISERHKPAIARGLDVRPGSVAGGAIEVNTVPKFTAKDKSGTTFTKIPKLQFPVDKDDRTTLIHNLTHYSKAALFDEVNAWVHGGAMPTGSFAPKGALLGKIKAQPLRVTQGDKNQLILGADQGVQTGDWDGTTFGLKWNRSAVSSWSKSIRKGSFLEYCRLSGGQLKAISADEVPAETGLLDAKFPPAASDQTYVSGSNPSDEWHKPGPKAGPFMVKLADGSTVTYSWYRFIDQPTIQSAILTEAEKNRLQKMVEQIHRKWTQEKQYMAPPKTGTLAALDTAMFVKPPKGLEFGYVPIVTRQSAK